MRNIVLICWRYSFAPPWKPFCCLFPSQLSSLVVQNFRCYKRPWFFLHPCPIFKASKSAPTSSSSGEEVEKQNTWKELKNNPRHLTVCWPPFDLIG